ncbi:MAG: sodium-dependent transporter [Clostridium sp.]|uniref:sodium-dependent transporter n=1 Tax=Clostridium sp. DSM 8431 TaxID=1761781 RepID=UPI0008E2AC03|nr:sodium-dependent transporter [Clostridium sp. DSM 8431]MCR4943603.1 sodium-dependent transporter [Clostridium sp.]SFU39270.1 neurotransmitter:Na+ symporter, NSS family [Clostridium sp. DSM 8431]
MEKREEWSSRITFILAAIGSAVGLGNAWRFPGLAAKYGGGAFLLTYAIAMLILGIPMLSMEISIGRKTRQGAPGAFKAMNKKTEYVGWAATTNAFAIQVYYAVVFAWVLLMAFFSFKFAGMVGDTESASSLFMKVTETSGTISGMKIPFPMALALIVAWVLIYACIRKGTVSVGKVVKYTGLTLPLIFLIIMAIKGMTMPHGLEGLSKLFVPDFSVISSKGLWSNLIIDAIGQVFYSLSIMMAIMVAYGSYLSDSTNIAKDATIIAFADLGVSILSGVVMFTTMYGVGMTTNDMSASGIATAFIIFPQAIVSLTSIGWINALFGFVFYACLSSLAIDSAFSIVEGVSTAVADRFKLDARKATKVICLISALISIVFITQSGLAWLDIVDNWTNQYNMIIIGAMECIVVGWIFKPKKVLCEINRNTNTYKIPKWWFLGSIKFAAPLALIGFGLWNLYSLFKSGGIYGVESGYPLWSNIVGGWLVTFIVFVSGFIIKKIINLKKENRI